MRRHHAARISIVLGFVLLSVGGQAAPQDPATPDKAQIAVKDWLTRSANPLKTVEATYDVEDLKPLKKILNGVSIVGLGEGSHGTREFFQLKHRMVEFLAQEMGFTVFVAEVNYSTSLAIDDYILSGKSHSNAESIPKPWPLDTLEWTKMLDWMREHNRRVTANKKIRFFGYDSRPNQTVLPIVVTYLQRVAADQVKFATDALRPVLDEPALESDLAVTRPNAGRPQRSDEEKREIHRNLEKLVSIFIANQAKFVQLTSIQEFNRVAHLVRTVAQYDDTFSRPWVSQTDSLNTGIAMREKYAIENIEWFLSTQKPGSKTILWAHNGHVSKGFVYAEVPTLGSFLSQKFGKAYYAMALLFGHGSFQARNIDAQDSGYGSVMEFVIKPGDSNLAEWYFGQSPYDKYYIDLHSASNSLVKHWLDSPYPMRYLLGGAFSYRWPPGAYVRPISLSKYYDGVTFVAETTRARPTASGVRPPLN